MGRGSPESSRSAARPIRWTNVVVRRELLRGLGRLNATTTVLQRARLADPLGGMWEAADVQWWWRRPRPTDELALPVWFDEDGSGGSCRADGLGRHLASRRLRGAVDRRRKRRLDRD